MAFSVVARFRDELEGCENEAQLKRTVAKAASELDFDCFAMICSRPSGNGPPTLFHIDNYPLLWTRRVIAERLYMRDPVLHASLRTNVGFSWDEIWRYIERNSGYLEILSEAAVFGLRDGFTIPGNVPFEPAASCTFATSSVGPITFCRRQTAQLIGADAINAARRINGWLKIPLRATLSPREREILYWIAARKSTFAISVILGISESTVKTHVGSILHKLDAQDRARAMLLAERAGLIASDLEF